MFGLGMPELVLILIVALLLFGPKRLPDLGRSIGRAIASFKEGLKEGGQEPDDKKSSDGDKQA
jgi:sec-independent protein translocase protein TatA